MNQFDLTATVLEAKPIRYTPAGVPVLEMLLQHESEVEQAGMKRRAELVIDAMASGDVALLMAGLSLGERLKVRGFLAASRKGSRKLVLHIQQVGTVTVAQDPVVV